MLEVELSLPRPLACPGLLYFKAVEEFPGLLHSAEAFESEVVKKPLGGLDEVGELLPV